MLALVIAVAALQAGAMLVDEGHFHASRPLPRWERVGHPLDTLSVAACYGWLCATNPGTPHALAVYAGIAAFSCLFVTKDEPLHARVCPPAEHWLHAFLFVLHPIVLAAFAWAWQGGHVVLVRAQLALTVAFGVYQVLRWNVARAPA
jgi:hypothetical protein